MGCQCQARARKEAQDRQRASLSAKRVQPQIKTEAGVEMSGKRKRSECRGAAARLQGHSTIHCQGWCAPPAKQLKHRLDVRPVLRCDAVLVKVPNEVTQCLPQGVRNPQVSEYARRKQPRSERLLAGPHKHLAHDAHNARLQYCRHWVAWVCGRLCTKQPA